jgi:hypothetical protein
MRNLVRWMAWPFVTAIFGIDDLFIAVFSTLVAGAASKALAPKPKAAALPPPPVVEPVTAMPTADDATAQAAKKRSLLEQRRRRGRASTILTDGADVGAGLGG